MKLTETRRTMIDVLAKTDRIFWPDRAPFAMAREQVAMERRREFFASGIDFTTGGQVAARLAGGRLLGELEAAGLLLIFRPTGRREGVRLTALGDAVTRRLCCMPTVAECWDLLQYLAEWQEFCGRAFPEHLAAGVEKYDGSDEQAEEIALMRQRLVPLLAAGYVETAGDGNPAGRCFWLKLTPAGLAALDGAPPADAPEGIEFSQEAAALYERLWDAAGRDLARAKPDNPQNLCPPVACSQGWGSLAACLRLWGAAR